MANDITKPSGQLQTIERWRRVELDEARGAHAEAEKLRCEHSHRVQALASSIVELQAFARSNLDGERSLTVESMLRLSAYAARQADEMAQADQKLQASTEASEQARTLVLQRFEQLAAVERLSERRNRDFDQDLVRRDQKRLDEQALSRVCGDATEQFERTREG